MNGRGVPLYALPIRYAIRHIRLSRCTALDTGQGVDALCRERVRLPALAAVLGAKHLAPARRTVHPVRSKNWNAPIHRRLHAPTPPRKVTTKERQRGKVQTDYAQFIRVCSWFQWAHMCTSW